MRTKKRLYMLLQLHIIWLWQRRDKNVYIMRSLLRKRLICIVMVLYLGCSVCKGQMLGDIGLKTRGWGNVSVENNHIDVFILICRCASLAV